MPRRQEHGLSPGDLHAAKHYQLVLMALKPKEEIGAEVHKLDQFFRVKKGTGEAILDGVHTAIRPGFAVVVPAGTNHNIVNTGTVPLKLYADHSRLPSKCNLWP